MYDVCIYIGLYDAVINITLIVVAVIDVVITSDTTIELVQASLFPYVPVNFRKTKRSSWFLRRWKVFAKLFLRQFLLMIFLFCNKDRSLASIIETYIITMALFSDDEFKKKQLYNTHAFPWIHHAADQSIEKDGKLASG